MIYLQTLVLGRVTMNYNIITATAPDTRIKDESIIKRLIGFNNDPGESKIKA